MKPSKGYPPAATVARADGRGTYIPYPKGTIKDHIGEKVYIAHREFKNGKDGRVNIPKSIMQAYGRLNDEGRRVLLVKRQYRGKHAGARLIQTPEDFDIDDIETGDLFNSPKGARFIEPNEDFEFYS